MILIKNFQEATFALTPKLSKPMNCNLVTTRKHLNFIIPVKCGLNTSFRKGVVSTKDLIKFNVQINTHWSPGMLSSLIFLHDEVYSKKFLNKLNAKKEWSLWKYAHSVVWASAIQTISLYTPWSLRVRRFFKLGIGVEAPILSIQYSQNSFNTPNRRIKRWLKKKYTTQSWR